MATHSNLLHQQPALIRRNEHKKWLLFQFLSYLAQYLSFGCLVFLFECIRFFYSIHSFCGSIPSAIIVIVNRYFNSGEKNVSIPRQTQSLPSLLIWFFRLGIEHDHYRMIIVVFRLQEIFIAEASNLSAAAAAIQHTHSTPKWCICHYHFALVNRAWFRWLNGCWTIRSNFYNMYNVQCTIQCTISSLKSFQICW